MKKLALVLAAVLLISCLSACNAPSENNEPSEIYAPALMTAEKKAELEQSLSMTGSWYSEENLGAKYRYYGTYEGYDIIFSEVKLSSYHNSHIISIANKVFLHTSLFLLSARKDGNTIDLKEAYEQGLVSKETIEKVAELHQQCYEKLFPAEE